MSEDMRPFAEDMAYDGETFVWGEERRFQLRAELGAAFFYLYLPTNPDDIQIRTEKETDSEYKSLSAAFSTLRHIVGYITEKVRIMKKKDMAVYGRNRTKEAILREYDGMMETMVQENSR